MHLYAQLNPVDSSEEGGKHIKQYKKILGSENLFIFVGTVDNRIIATCYLNIIPNLTNEACSSMLVVASML